MRALCTPSEQERDYIRGMREWGMGVFGPTDDFVGTHPAEGMVRVTVLVNGVRVVATILPADARRVAAGLTGAASAAETA